MKTKTCRRCGAEFVAVHHNARFCGDACRAAHKVEYMKGWQEAHPRTPKEPEAVEPFPEGIDREAFGSWLSGFADGEGSFGLRLQGSQSQVHCSAIASFRITLRDDDAETLDLIRSYFGCGRLAFAANERSGVANAKPIAIYGVQSISELARVVIPHFERFPLRSKKQRDFAVWRQGVELVAEVQARPLIYRPGHRANRHGGTFPKWTEEERQRFREVEASLKDQRRYRDLRRF